MAPRANWKGFLRLSLVSCPIALYPASSFSEKVSFNRINRKTGNRLKQQNIDSETGEVVLREDTARGYEVGKGQYLIVEDEEFEAVQIESTRTIEIDQFVPRNEIDDRYIDSPYYIAPDGQVGQDAAQAFWRGSGITPPWSVPVSSKSFKLNGVNDVSELSARCMSIGASTIRPRSSSSSRRPGDRIVTYLLQRTFSPLLGEKLTSEPEIDAIDPTSAPTALIDPLLI